MRNHLGFIALSLLAAAFAGCSSADKDITSSSSKTSSGGDLTGALAKYNAAIVPLGNDCVVDANKTKVTYTLKTNEILVLSLRSVDKALLANGKECVYTDAKSVVGPMTTKALKYIDVVGAAGTEATAETVIVDVRNGIFAAGNISVDLKGQQTDADAAGDEIAVLGATTTDKVVCSTVTANGVTTDLGIDLNGDKTADIKPVPFYTPDDDDASAPYHYTIDLNAGDDTFDQGACVTSMSVYGSAGKDTITIGSSSAGVGDVFSGGTDGTTTESVDTITFAARTSGVHVTLDTTADDGAGDGLTEKDKVLGDFEVVTGTKYDDVLVAGSLGGNEVAGEPTKATSYTLNGSDGDDVLSSKQNYGTAFNGGAGVDTVTYAARTAGVTVTMDGKTADDGEKAAAGGPTGATLDNVAVDIENLIGSDFADKITGNASNNWFKPGAGADVVIGGDGDDLMLSGKADGSDAADDDDIFQGGVGNDTVDYSNRIASSGVTVNLDCTFTAATVAGTKSAGTASGGVGESDYIGLDVEDVVGTVGDDTINGSSVPNSIWSMGGEDTISGGAGSDQLDANVYEGTYVTANGYQCDGSLDCYDSTGTILNPQPADCDCKTPAGYRCEGNTTDDCIDPSTGVAYTVAPGDCDCDIIAGTTVEASTCNPVTGAALDATVISVVGVTCLSGSYDTGTCDASTAITCGGDPMDVATCEGGAGGQFIGCWKTQT